MTGLETAGAAVAVVVGGISLVAGFAAGARWVWRSLRRLFQTIDAIALMLGDGTPQRPGALAQIEAVRAEVSLNSGKSLKDEVVRVREEIQTFRVLIDDHLRWHQENSGVIDPSVSLTRRQTRRR